MDYADPFCRMIDSKLINILTFDTSGIELYVTGNNPKTLNSLIKKLKSYYKDNPDVDWICDCDKTCSAASCGRTTYTYENMDLRMFSGIQRDTDEWDRL